MKVCIALTRPQSKPYTELGEMILDALSAWGCAPDLVEDGNRDVLKADVLLLVGDACGFDGFARILGSVGDSKPTVLLWQLEPLPPPTLSEGAERIGLRASVVADRVKLPPGPISRLIKAIVPVAARHKVVAAISGPFFLGFNKEMAKTPGQEFMEVDTLSRRIMMTRYRSLKRRLSEGWLDYVFVSNVAKAEFLASRGVRAELAPVGYHPLMGKDLGVDRDIDVVFIGDVSYPRRERILKTLLRDLVSRGIKLMIVGQGCFGHERTELLNRARISLNLASHPCSTQGFRFLMSMGCGALVVSESLYNAAPFRVGEHFVQASVADLPNTIAHYLANKSEREEIVRSAHNFITKELTIQNAIKHIMGVCGADSALPTGNM